MPAVVTALSNRNYSVKNPVRDGIPYDDDRYFGAIVLEPEDTDRRGAEKKMLRLVDRQSDPSRAQDTAKLAMRE